MIMQHSFGWQVYASYLEMRCLLMFEGTQNANSYYPNDHYLAMGSSVTFIWLGSY